MLIRPLQKRRYFMEEKLGGYASLYIRLFGGLEIRVNGEPIPKTKVQKDILLIAHLALKKGQSVDRAKLAHDLWPGSVDINPDRDQARINFNLSLHRAGKALGEQKERLIVGGGRVALDVHDAYIDAIEFDELLTKGDEASLSKAHVICREGRLLLGVKGELAEEWRNEYLEKTLSAYQQLSDIARTRGDYETATQRLREAEKLAPYCNEIHRKQINLLIVIGHLDEAMNVADRFLKTQRKIGVAPDEKTVELHNRLRVKKRAVLKSRNSPSTSVTESLIGFMPRPVTPLVGRENDIYRICVRLVDYRLLTLTGPGGVGKTRLAIEAATRVQSKYTHGAWFINLVPATDNIGVLKKIAQELQISENPGQDLQYSVLEHLRSKHILLVLDNCEHLVDICANFVELALFRCNKLHILTTSRQPLGLKDNVYHVPTLTQPEVDDDQVNEGALLQQSTAAELFMSCASRVNPAIVLRPENIRSIAYICRRLDGIPLALELAAAWTTTLSLCQIAQRLEDEFDLLDGVFRDAPERHQTLRATTDWSYRLLSQKERRIFEQVSIFSASWTLEAAEGIFFEPGIPKNEVASLLKSLRDKSLLTSFTNRHGIMRYRMLEAIKVFACECLKRNGDRESLFRRYAEWFINFATQADAKLYSFEQEVWIIKLNSEMDNFRAIMDECLKRKESEKLLNLVGVLSHYWYIGGHYIEGHRWLTTALAGGSISPDILRARPLINAGFMANNIGTKEPNLDQIEAGIKIAKELGDARLTSDGLVKMGYVLRQRDPERARALLEQALDESLKTDDAWIIADAFSTLGWFELYNGSKDRVVALFSEGMGYAQKTQDPRLLDEFRYHIGLTLISVGKYPAAEIHLQQCQKDQRRMNGQIRLAKTLHYLAIVAFHNNDCRCAVEYLRESLEIGVENNHKRIIVAALEGLARICWGNGLHILAVHTVSTVETHLEGLDSPLLSFWEPSLDSFKKHMCDTLGEDIFQAHWITGQLSSFKDISEEFASSLF